MEVLIVIWLICGVAGGMIGSTKGRGVEGFLLGLILGVIGLIVIAAVGPSEAYARAHPVPATYVTPPPAPAPPALAPGQSLTDALSELEALRAEGIIADDEFTAAKRRLLGL